MTLDESLYRRYGMYLAVLAASTGVQPGHSDSLFPDQPRPRPRDPYPWDACVVPIPEDAVRHHPRLQPGVPADWRLPQDFIHDLVRWVRVLAWMPGPAEVSWAELACHWGNEPKFCARRWDSRSATWRQAQCWVGPHWGAAVRSSPLGATRAQGFRPARTSWCGTKSCPADAPGGALPRLVGPAHAGAGAHAATAQ